MELGKLTAIIEADTRDFDSKIKASEARIESLKARLRDIKADKSLELKPFKAELIGVAQRDLNAALKGHKSLQAAQKATAQSAKAMGQDLGNALSTVSPRLGALAGAAGPLTALAAGLVAVGAAGVGIYKLATFSQQLGAEIFDLSQKINFTAETLSSLKVAAELSGGSLDSLATSLGIFDRNIEEAREGGNEMSRVFKALKIDTDDNEKALRQAFTALGKLAGGSQQTALAMKLFGRSGKEVLGIIKETGGDVDKFIEKMRDMGLVITSEGAKKADQFGDRLKLLQDKIEALGRQIGSELVPIVENAADDISGWLKDNQKELVNTARDAASLISALLKLANFIRENSPVTFVVRIVRQIMDSEAMQPRAYGAPAGGLESGTLDLGSLNAPAALPKDLPTLSPFQRRGGPTVFSPFANPNTPSTAPARLNIPGPSRGGGGGGGGKAQKDVLEGLKREVMSLNTEFRKLDTELFNSANMTELAAEKEKILSEVVSQLSDKAKMSVSTIKDVDQALDAAIGSLPAKSQKAAQALRQQALAQFEANEKTRIAGELAKSTENLAKDWRQEIENTRTGADSYAIAIQGLEKEYRKYGMTLDESTKKELDNAAAQIKHWTLFNELIGNASTRIQAHINLLDTLNTLTDAVDKSLTGPGTDIGNLNDFLTIEPPDLSEASKRILQIREEMRNVAADITSVFDRALYDGISGGAKRGLQSLALGILDMIQQVILGNLKNALAEALGGVATRGGFFGGLLRAIFGGAISGAAGGIGGGAVSTGSSGVGGGFSFGMRASGGPVSAMTPYMVGEQGPELFVPHTAGNILNKQQMGGQTTVININLPPTPPGSYKSPQSQRQLASQVVAALQGAQR